MKHPISQKIQYIFIYAGFWTVILGLHIATLVLLYQIDWLNAIIDGLVFNTLFALLGIALWYPVFYNDPEKQSISMLLINHLSIMVLSLAFWVSSGVFICKQLLQDYPRYIQFVDAGIPWRIYSGIFFYFSIVLVYYLLIYGYSLREHMLQESVLREKINEAELQSLKSQINPHFLFNSLNSISSLTITNPEKAHEMIINLSGFLRYSLAHDPTNLIPFQQEIENMDAYIAVEKIRFGDKLVFVKKICEPCYQHRVPFLILQPLIENAIKHGVYESMEPVTVVVECEKLPDQSIKITVGNNFDPEAVSRKGTGTGIKNITERLKIIYQLNDLFTIEKKKDYFTVQLILPNKPAFTNSNDL
jgi:two-component system LytT family sensor kinase